jgi:prolyl-tRNA synthetase
MLDPEPRRPKVQGHLPDLLRGDHNSTKSRRQKIVGEFRFARDDEIVAALGCKPGYIGPVGGRRGGGFRRSQRGRDERLRLRRQRSRLPLTGVNFGRDLPSRRWSPISQRRRRRSVARRQRHAGTLPRRRSGAYLPVAHQVRRSAQMQFSRRERPEQIMEMGCYGIGVTRIVGAAIEQGHDRARHHLSRRRLPRSKSASCRWATPRAKPSRPRPMRFTPN